jgi:AcrR family transcriptional regulator
MKRLRNLYNHFKGKEAILVFIAEIEGQELSGFIVRLSSTDDLRATLEGFITDYAVYVALGRVAQITLSVERALPETDFRRCVRN